jgi:hypothetical protein
MGKEIYVSLFPLFLIFLGVELFRITINLLAIKYNGHAASQAWLMVG